VHVPYKGAGAVLQDLLGGQVQMLVSAVTTTLPHIKSGKLRALGVGGLTRNPVLPDIPTIAEAGVPTYESVNWWGLVAPAGTPPAIVEKLHREIAAVQDNPEVQQQFANEGASVVKMSTAEFAQHMVKEMNKWERVVKEGGIKAE
jgi:tripartite-type tricarboxylate transporter receptor subunit TctC